MRIEPIRVLDFIDQAESLQREHWEELAKHKGLMVLAPDRALYERMEPLTVALGLFDRDNFVGYSVNFFCEHHPHYRGLSILQNDVLFVSQSYRLGGAGIRLIRATEDAGRARGASLMVWHAKPDTDLEHILPRMGCQVLDVLFSKEL